MRFEWDEEKNRSNINKHGISFQLAAKVFGDDNKLIFRDFYHGGFEERWIVIGRVLGILFVVYTERGDAIRLISARRATDEEEMLYYDNI